MKHFNPKFLVVFLGIMITLFSCQTEDDYIETNTQRIPFDFWSFTTNGKNLAKDHPYASDKISHLNDLSMRKSGQSSGVQLDTSNIKIIQTADATSYIFRVTENVQMNIVKNYVLVRLRDSLWHQYMVNYPLDAQRQIITSQIVMAPVYGDDIFNQVPFKCGSSSFVSVWVDGYTIDHPCTAGGNHTVADGDACQAWGKPNGAKVTVVFGHFETQLIAQEPCDGGGGGAPITDPPSTDFPGGGAASSGSGTNSGSQNPTIPGDDNSGGSGANSGSPNDLQNDESLMIAIGVVPNLPPIPSIADAFFNNLSNVFRNFIQSTAQNQLRVQIENYLMTNNFSPEATGFATEVIKAKKESSNAEIDFENLLIFDASVPECLKSIINKLKPTEGFNVNFAGVDNRLLQQMQLPNMILDLFNNDAGYSLKIETANIPPDPISGLIPNAQTSNLAPSTVPAGDVFNITITMNNSYLSAATDLALARTMIHELTHAYFSYLRRSQPQSDIAQQLQFLMNDAAGPRQSSNDADHQIIANQFIDTIANALGVWDNDNKILQRNGFTFDYYKLLSWSGQLIDTDYFTENMSAEFQYFSILANKAEQGIVSILDPEMLPPKGQNNCN